MASASISPPPFSIFFRNHQQRMIGFSYVIRDPYELEVPHLIVTRLAIHQSKAADNFNYFSAAVLSRESEFRNGLPSFLVYQVANKESKPEGSRSLSLMPLHHLRSAMP